MASLGGPTAPALPGLGATNGDSPPKRTQARWMAGLLIDDDAGRTDCRTQPKDGSRSMANRESKIQGAAPRSCQEGGKTPTTPLPGGFFAGKNRQTEPASKSPPHVGERRVRGPLLCGCSKQDRWPQLILTVAPAPSSCVFMASASSFERPSLTDLGASSTRALASFRPRPVMARTSLIT